MDTKWNENNKQDKRHFQRELPWLATSNHHTTSNLYCKQRTARKLEQKMCYDMMSLPLQLPLFFILLRSLQFSLLLYTWRKNHKYIWINAATSNQVHTFPLTSGGRLEVELDISQSPVQFLIPHNTHEEKIHKYIWINTATLNQVHTYPLTSGGRLEVGLDISQSPVQFIIPHNRTFVSPLSHETRGRIHS